MAVEAEKSGFDGKVWSFCRMPFWQGRNGSSSSSSSLTSMHNNAHQQNQSHQSVDRMNLQSSNTVSSVAKSFLPTRRRLRLDPPNKLFFPCKLFWVLTLIFHFCCIIFFCGHLSFEWFNRSGICYLRHFYYLGSKNLLLVSLSLILELEWFHLVKKLILVFPIWFLERQFYVFLLDLLICFHQLHCSFFFSVSKTQTMRLFFV